MFSRKNSVEKVEHSAEIRSGSVVRYEEFSQKLTLRIKLFYSFGHVYNDLCASIWFSYTLLFFKLSFDDTTAGLLLLLGQVADAISTPLVGYGSDKNLKIFRNYGRRKVWHLIGSVVTCVFPLIFSSCLLCTDSVQWEKFVYYSVLIALFQFGWAAVQVAHLSLITDLTDVSSERVELNAFRQAATVASSICVYTITLLFLGVDDSTISQSDSVVFMKVVHLITVIGIVFSVLFHVFIKEPSVQQEWELKEIEEDIEKPANQQVRARCDSHYSTNLTEPGSNACVDRKKTNLLEKGLDKSSNTNHDISKDDDQAKCKRTGDRNGHIWSDWLSSVSFWKICVIYMMSRLYVNVTQVYTPLYLQETLRLAKRNIAIVPFITYFAGFICSMLIKSRKINAKIIMCVGCFFSFISCVWIWYCYLQISIWEVFMMAAVFGIGGTFMLIGSLSLTADLIDDNKISGAFVYGLMSFFDKLINGAVIALVQHLKPSSSGMLSIVDLAGTNQTNVDSLWNANSSVPFNQSSPVMTSPIPPSLSTDPTVFYLYVLVFVSGAAVIGTFFALILIMRKEVNKLWHSIKRLFIR